MHTKSQNETSQFQPASATQSTDTDNSPKGVALAPPPFQFKSNPAAEYETEQETASSQSFLSTTGDAGNNGASAIQLKEANPNERWGVDQFFEGYQAEVDRSGLTEEEQAYFDNYAQRAQVYLSRPNMKWTDGVLTGQMFADAALQTYLKYGKDMTKVVPVEFALTQGQFESHLGITGRSPSDNPFNVGEYDDRSADWVDRIENPSQGIAMYYDLMAEDYLSTKTPDQLLENGNFVNEAGARYASNTNYESDLRSQINFIDGYIDRSGGQEVSAPSGTATPASTNTTTPTTTTPTSTSPSAPTADNDYQAARPDLSRNSGSRAHNRWSQRGEASGYADDFNATIDDQVAAIFGAGYTRERVMQEIQEAQASGDIETANDLRRQLFTANIYNVVETLDVDSNSLYQRTSSATFCNIYAYDVVTAMGGYLPRVWWNTAQEQEFIAAAERGEEYEERATYGGTVHEMNANALTAWMPRIGQTYFGWQRAESMRAAQESANNGNLVIILAANKVASKSGHVNVILPETEQHQSATDDNGTFRPLQSQAGGSNFKYQPHSTAWWEDSSHKNGAAWIATGQMDSPIMTPEQLGVQEAVSEESTETDTDGGSQVENPNTTDETSPDGGNGGSWFSGIIDRVSDTISNAIDTIGEWISDLVPQQTGVVSSEALNVRAGHNASFEIVRTPLRKGESISIYEEKNGWYRIGHEQWVSGKHINVLEASQNEEGTTPENGGQQTDTPTTEQPDTPESSTERGIVTASSLNVRNGSNAQAPKVGEPLRRGTTVTIYEENNAWYRIGDGQWVSGRYVTKLGGHAGGAEGQPNWIDIAQGEIGVQEIAGSEHNSRVLEYHSTTGGHATDEVPWCASFVNWVMIQSGHGGNNSAWAQSWKNYGKDLGQPAYGAIAVIRWNSSSGHVGFVVGKNGNNVLLLGGNQSNSVNITSFSTSKVIAYVVPASYEVPESAFTFGATNGEVEEGSFEGSR